MLDASLEVRSAIVFATASVVLVFLPLLTLGGLQGAFFAPLAQSYLLAILASLVVALTVTPALSPARCSEAGGRHPREPRLQTRLKAAYARVLARVIVAAPAARASPRRLVAAAALAVFPFLGGEFLPEFRERHLVLQVTTAPGTALDEMLRIGRRISQRAARAPAHRDGRAAGGPGRAGRGHLGPEPAASSTSS